MAVTEDHITGCYNLKIKSSYDRLCKVAARFLKYFGQPFDFEPDVKDNLLKKFDALISWFEKKVEEQGLSLATLKHDPYDEDCGDIDFVVYSTCSELEMKVIIFIASPAETLPHSARELYMEFIKFVSDRMCIELGNNSDNYYLDMVFSYHDDPEQDIEELDGTDREYLQKRRDVIAAYKENGAYWKLFKQIERLKPENLEQRIREYVKKCEYSDVKRLFQVILEGLPIIQKMNIHWFDFNPDFDGIEENEDSFIDTLACQAILYSNNDGIENALINTLENDYNCGVCPVGYNIHLWLSEETKDEHIEELMENLDLGSRFAEWNIKFYDVVKVFDKIQEEQEDEYI